MPYLKGACVESQPATICSNLTIETLDKDVKHVQC